MTEVWESGETHQGTLLVMLALADWANDSGVCWPTIGKLAEKARMSDRQVQRILVGLQKDGRLRVEQGGGRGQVNRYFLTVTPSHPLPQKGDTHDTKRVTSEAQKGDICDIAIRKNRQEPSGGPSPAPEVSDLPPMALAQKIALDCCLPRFPGMIQAIAGAIEFCVQHEGKSNSGAAEFLEKRVLEETRKGTPPNRFWFDDRKWRKAENGLGRGYVPLPEGKP